MTKYLPLILPPAFVASLYVLASAQLVTFAARAVSTAR